MIRRAGLGAFQSAVVSGVALAGGVLITLNGRRALEAAVFVVVACALLVRPPLALGVLLAATVLLEADPSGFLPQTARFYARLPGRIAPTDLLLLILVLGTLMQLGRERRPPRRPGILTLPLLLLLGAIGFGLLNGAASGWNRVDALNSTRVLIYLVVLPFVVVNVVRTRAQVLGGLALLTALAAAKSIEGVVAYASGAGGRVVSDIGARIAYLEPTPNWLMVAFLLGLVAAIALRIRLPAWTLWVAPLAVAALALSFRRSFWIAFVLGLAAVLLLARGTGRRRIVIPAVVTAALVLWAATALGNPATPGTPNPILARAKTVNPTSLATRPNDRYRLEERRNVLAAIRDRPVTGLGLGVHWRIRYPLSQYPKNVGYYVHAIVLTYWLRAGLAGVLAYVTLMVAALVAAFRISRGHPDRLVRAAGLGIAGAIVGLIAAETTASFTGDDLRFTILFAIVLGGLASASAQLGTTTPDGASATDAL